MSSHSSSLASSMRRRMGCGMSSASLVEPDTLPSSLRLPENSVRGEDDGLISDALASSTTSRPTPKGFECKNNAPPSHLSGEAGRRTAATAAYSSLFELEGEETEIAMPESLLACPVRDLQEGSCGSFFFDYTSVIPSSTVDAGPPASSSCHVCCPTTPQGDKPPQKNSEPFASSSERGTSKSRSLPSPDHVLNDKVELLLTQYLKSVYQKKLTIYIKNVNLSFYSSRLQREL
ncbi:unnamed protein product [Amoebophrya sp. A25]|nr:unnamed protein product [Amoebophrya sp. A25]|eukprot:GSA25T00001978001.1